MGSRAAYSTRPRELIAKILREQPRFLTAAEVHHRLDDAGEHISLSTVYRTLDYLQSKAVVTARTDGQGETAFMHCEPTRHHHHAICRRCGRVEDVSCTVTEEVAESLRARHGFELDEHAMEFFGTCSTCH